MFLSTSSGGRGGEGGPALLKPLEKLVSRRGSVLKEPIRVPSALSPNVRGLEL